ncbi:MAG: hypothetical protein K0U78_06070 [Actinomycetia bacterium]|nr:hypothetical protein [Actinomycetes bacterium]
MTMPGAPDGGEEIVLDRAKFDAALTDLGDLQTEIATSGEEYAAALSAVAAAPLQPGQTRSPALAVLTESAAELSTATTEAAAALGESVAELVQWRDTVTAIDTGAAADVEATTGEERPK